MNKTRHSIQAKFLLFIFLALLISSVEPLKNYLSPDFLTVLILLISALFPIPLIMNLKKGISTSTSRSIFLVLYTIFWIWNLYTAIDSPNSILSAQRILLNLLPCIFIISITFSNNFNKKDVDYFLNLYVNLSIFMVFYSVVLLAIGTTDWEPEVGFVNRYSFLGFQFTQREFGVAPVFRASSILENPNSFSLWVATALAILHYQKKEELISKKSFNIKLLILFIGLGLSFSRAAILSYISFTFLFFVLSNSIEKIISKFFVGLAAIAVSTLWFFLFYFQSVSFNESRFSTSLNSRDTAWQILYGSLMERPISGVGFGISNEAVLRPNGIDFAAHNVHLQFLSETGFIGYILFFFILISPVIINYLILNRSIKITYLYTFSSCWSISILLHQFFENTLFRFGFFTFLWFFIILIPLILNEKQTMPSKS